MDDVRMVEVVISRTRPGVTDEQVLALADELQAAVEGLPGYLGRRLLRVGDGRWLDVVDWTSREAAEQANETVMRLPCAALFGELMDVESMEMLHVEPVRTWSRCAALT